MPQELEREILDDAIETDTFSSHSLRPYGCKASMRSVRWILPWRVGAFRRQYPAEYICALWDWLEDDPFAITAEIED